MSAGWVAGGVRARALVRRCLGPTATRPLAASSSLADALQTIADTAYGQWAKPGHSLAAAQQAIANMILWELRVLAGWLPRDGVQMLRTLAGWFEIANVDEQLQAMTGRPAGPQFRLGSLATAWPQLDRAASPAELRAALAASSWLDPGGDSALAIRRGMRARWAGRVAAWGDPMRSWAAGAAAILLASERFAAGRPVDPAVLRGVRNLVGPTAFTAPTLEDLTTSLPQRARWALFGISSADDLWRAERFWWRKVESAGFGLLASSGWGSQPVLGAVAVMGADARRVNAALEAAARGGGLEAYDAVA